MRKTIYLPDDLAARVEEYLEQHKDKTFSSLVQDALKQKVESKSRSSILDLIGFVSVEPSEAGTEFEDRPEDSTVDWYDGPPR